MVIDSISLTEMDPRRLALFLKMIQLRIFSVAFFCDRFQVHSIIADDSYWRNQYENVGLFGAAYITAKQKAGNWIHIFATVAEKNDDWFGSIMLRIVNILKIELYT